MTDEEKSPTGHGRAEESSTNQTNNPSVPHTQGSAAPMPSSESAELATLLDAFVAIFKKHLSLPEGAPEAMALWVVSAHNLDSSNFAPRLGLSSPLRVCG